MHVVQFVVPENEVWIPLIVRLATLGVVGAAAVTAASVSIAGADGVISSSEHLVSEKIVIAVNNTLKIVRVDFWLTIMLGTVL